MLLAQRLSTPVYRLKAEMPASELAKWIMFLREESAASEPPSIDDIGADGIAAAMGIRPEN